MKNLLLVTIVALLITFSARAQYITIPDPEFRSYLINRYPTCFNASEMMDTTCSAIINETYLAPSYYISNWEGFQYFRNLQVVGFEHYYSTDLPVLPATLKELYIDPMGSSFTSLPALPNGLIKLTCTSVQYLTSLPVLPSTLAYLNCSSNPNLTSLPALPNSLRYLRTSRMELLSSLPALPGSLDTLECDQNALTSLPPLPSSLLRLVCNSNLLISLPTLPAQIVYLDASNNQLTAIPAVAGTVLTTLNVARNSITTLPALPASLQIIDVSRNQLTALPPLPAGLSALECSLNQLSSLPAIPASMLRLGFGSNMLPVYPTLPNTLRDLNCSSCGITNIPSFPDSLTNLNCSGNLLTSLPVFPPYLAYIDCSTNQLSALPPLPDTLVRLSCQENNITCLPVLPPGRLAYGNMNDELFLYFDDLVTCVANYPVNQYSINVWHSSTGTYTSYIAYMNPAYPLCSAVNNVNQCAAFPLMTGRVYYDNNNNSTHDVGEPYRSNVKVQLSDGSFTFTDNNGFYRIMVRDTGHYSLTAEPPLYFASVPAAYDFYFINFDTLVIKDFGFQATSARDSLDIHINPVNAAARPGFPYPYQIAYENNGTTTLNPNIVFNYDNTRLIYDSCSNASVINTGNSLTFTETGFAPGMQEGFIGYFRVNPSAIIGDSLRAGAHIMAGSTAAHDSDVVEIRGSFDPNDKSATPSLSPAQVINGDYIYYTIRFQNTGTDTAFNIVVTDTLDNKLQPSTLQMIATSHPCITTVKNNTISFEFINILLPDSNVNELKSHGYISFRIKPLNTLVVNDVVPNSAAIYFDFNSPVITNVATTTIVEPIVVPLKLLSFNVSRVGKQANLYWQTSHEVNVQHYEIEMSSNGRIFTNIGIENAKGLQYNSYTKTITIPADAVLYFRLKMMDIDGHFTYSSIAILKNDQANNAFSFSNNPVKDELTISLRDESLRNTTATIFNAQGIKVRTIMLQHDVEYVNIRSLPAGMYYLVTEEGSGRFVVVK